MSTADSSDMLCPHAKQPAEPCTGSDPAAVRGMELKGADPTHPEVNRCEEHDENAQSSHRAASHEAICRCGYSQNGTDGALAEAPHAASHRGLDRPTLVPHTIEYMDATLRGEIAKGVLKLFGLVVSVEILALVVGTFVGVPTADLAGYFQTVTTSLLSLVTLALGYYFGARHARARDAKS